LRKGKFLRGGLEADAEVFQPAQELFLALLIALSQVQHNYTRQEVGPEEGLIGCFFVTVEQDNFLPIFSLDLVAGHAEKALTAFAQQSAGGLFFLTDEEVNEKAFAYLPGTNKGHNIQCGIGLIAG
jgi:hypothetical protein